MLTRIRIEVEGEDSAAACEEALTKYEHAIQTAEYERYVAAGREIKGTHTLPVWSTPVVERNFYNGQLGREVTDEVIEYDASIPGYKGRRVVCFRRIDTRSTAAREALASGSISFAAPDKAAA